MKKETGSAFSQRVKVLSKLYDADCKTEKDLQSLTTETILQIPDITVPDMAIIIGLQKSTKANKLFTYLGGGADENNTESSG